jgi:hypothetical protein
LAFVAAGPTIAQLGRFAKLPPEQSLSRDETLAASMKKLPSNGNDALWLFPSKAPPATPSGGEGTAVAVQLSAKALKFVSVTPGARLPALAKLQKKASEPVLRFLPGDAFLVASFNADPQSLLEIWNEVTSERLRRGFTEAGFDVKADVLDNLKPGAGVAVSVSPEVKLGVGLPALDVRRTNPFRYVHLSGIAHAKDGAAAARTLEKLVTAAPRFQAKIEPSERSGKKVFLTSYAQGEGVHFAAVGSDVVFGSPLGRFDQLLAVAEGKVPDAGPGDKSQRSASTSTALNGTEWSSMVEDKPVVVVVDLQRLAQSLRELPSEAWGIGGFAIKATTLRWLEAMADLKAVTLSLAGGDGAIHGEVSLRLGGQP